MQTVAYGWLVLQLTDSPFAVGLVTTLGSLPILFFTLVGGIVADRVNKQRFILVLQSLMLLEALTLGILTQFGWVSVAWVAALAFFLGLLTAFEVPTRQAFVAELVGKGDLMNAIALNSSSFNLARVIGPALAAGLIATAGLAACFFANALSYVAVIVGLRKMRLEEVVKDVGPIDMLSAFHEGYRFVSRERWPRALMLMTGVFSIFGYSFMTMMPVFARDVLGLGASGYGAIVASVGVGAAAAAISLAWFGSRISQRTVALGSASVFGMMLSFAAFSPNLWVALAFFTCAGCMMALNGIAANTLLQRQAPDHLRGRVMGFYSFVVLGLAPFGSLQAGWVTEHFGARISFGVGGAICAVTAALINVLMRRRPRRR
jgi:MFS family permease